MNCAFIPGCSEPVMRCSHNPSQVICTKVRDGDKRIVRLKEGTARGRHVVIVDDLVQSGAYYSTYPVIARLCVTSVGRTSSLWTTWCSRVRMCACLFGEASSGLLQ